MGASEARPRYYDALEAPSAKPKPLDPYRPVGLSAFKSERAGLLTQRVLVRGRLGWLGDLGTLRSEVGLDNKPVWINFARLSPQRLRALKEQCPRRCLAAVSGSVGHVFAGIGLAADGIEVAP